MPRREPADVRFWCKVEKTETCWLWTAGRNDDGYGLFWDGTATVRAHRWAYEALVGPIPEGLHLDHLCRVRHCVNPAHLDPVTNAVNAARGEPGVHVREKAAAITHCPKGHEYSTANTRTYKTGAGRTSRRCRTCGNVSRRVTHAVVLPLDGTDGEQR